MKKKKSLQPIDRVAIALMLGLSILIAMLLMSGVYAAPRVRSFSWQDKILGATDRALIVTFSRPMNQETVEDNLKIEPPMPGKFSWAGRRMAYTLTSAVPYGTSFTVQLRDAKDRFGKNTPIKPFVGKFRSRDRAFAYIGVEGEEAGRLVLYNMTKQSKEVITPKNLVVRDFQVYPSRDRILFSASDRRKGDQGILEQKIYRVSTGVVVPSSGDKSVPTRAKAGRIETVLDNRDYRNLKFDLSPDGQTIVVQRINRQDSAALSLWVVRGAKAQPLKSKPGGEFTITPDGRAIALTQGQGIAILPLDPDLEEVQPINFLPQFGMVLDFAPDGTTAAMVKFNPNYTRSLFLVSSSELQKVFDTDGSITSCQFDPTKTTLYCLLSQLKVNDEVYQELPYIAAVDLKRGKLKPLLALPPDRRDIQISVSPDGLALLFDEPFVNPGATHAIDPSNSQEAIVNSSRLWLLPLVNIFSSGGEPYSHDPTRGEPEQGQQLQPQELPWKGFHPRWLP